LVDVVAYVDGFNLDHGLKAKHGRRYLWLDLEALVASLLKRDQRLEAIKYFTASVRDDLPARARQSTYLAALSAHTGVQIIVGRFQEKHRTCWKCGATWRTYEESGR
jgi:hypothetical protein